MSTSSKQNAAIITLDELARIKDSCALHKERDVERREQERQELYQKSQARVKNWPNTIQALRKKKDEDRIKRLEAEEIARRKVDAEEEALQFEQRRQALMKLEYQMNQNQVNLNLLTLKTN